MKRILVVCPTHRDLRELPNFKQYEIVYYGDDASEHPETFDVDAFIENALSKFRDKKIDGILSTDDYPGCIVASILAKEMGLSGADPRKLLLCQHKYYSRIEQRLHAPKSVPSFALINPLDYDSIELEFPFFVKPVKSFFSVLAQKVETMDELEQFVKLSGPHLIDFVKPFNQLLKKYTDFKINGSYLLAEGLLSGTQVTVEGFSFQGNVTIIGIADSVMFPGTISFMRFDYPSRLPEKIKQNMAEIAKRLIKGIGIDNSLFNIEMFYETATDNISIIEINPRMCSQFADLVEKVDGINTYDIQLALSLGREPIFLNKKGKYELASSFVLRTFEDKLIKKLPSENEMMSIMQKFTDARVEIFGREGRKLSEELQDGKSYRYGIINLGGNSRIELDTKFEECKNLLGFDFVNL